MRIKVVFFLLISGLFLALYARHALTSECTLCHLPRKGDHLSEGVTPRMPVPPNLPLSPEGEMECTTCHYPHSGGEEPAGVRMEGSDLCLACHPR